MPCLIIDPASADETNLINGNWSQERKLQEVSIRPPLMKDYFNKDLTEEFDVRKADLCIKVEYKTEKFTT
jgi:hypothetical protein